MPIPTTTTFDIDIAQIAVRLIINFIGGFMGVLIILAGWVLVKVLKNNKDINAMHVWKRSFEDRMKRNEQLINGGGD